MLTKFALLLLLIFAVFYGGRALARLGKAPAPRRRPERKASATQLVECPRCGAYVPDGRCNCGQNDDPVG